MASVKLEGVKKIYDNSVVAVQEFNLDIKDKEFVEIVKERWPCAKEKFEKIPAFIDSEMERLRNSNAINNEMWPITKTVNGDEHMSYDEAVARMKKAYVDKLEWLDNQIKNM